MLSPGMTVANHLPNSKSVCKSFQLIAKKPAGIQAGENYSSTDLPARLIERFKRR